MAQRTPLTHSEMWDYSSTVAARCLWTRSALYGGFAGEPFTDDSPEFVFVAGKPSR